ncbi:hypothetical protein DL95DRAFT_419005 [Leptodontidium sp. 2 PMI_412]|nr:hypothetical protein DL95DRAFT_419005 [Leptodontidium sp. 2 PMI_412]
MSPVRIPYRPASVLPVGIPPLNLFRMWAHSPSTLPHAISLGSFYRRQSEMSENQRDSRRGNTSDSDRSRESRRSRHSGNSTTGGDLTAQTSPNSDDDDDLPSTDELLSGTLQKNSSASADPNGVDDDGFVDIDDVLSGIQQKSVLASANLNSGGIAVLVDNGTRGGSPADSSCSTAGSSRVILTWTSEPRAILILHTSQVGSWRAAAATRELHSFLIILSPTITTAIAFVRYQPGAYEPLTCLVYQRLRSHPMSQTDSVDLSCKVISAEPQLFLAFRDFRGLNMIGDRSKGWIRA